MSTGIMAVVDSIRAKLARQRPTPDELKSRIAGLLELADVRIDGDRPWDMRVHDSRLYARLLAQGSLGLGESYMDGWWDCHRLDDFSRRVVSAGLDGRIRTRGFWLSWLKAWLLNPQHQRRAYEIGERHYDIGNDLYERMLDRRRIYSCGYWRDARDLDEAQEAKLELTFRKLGLEAGMKVLDIGCGWGGAARYAAERYRVKVVGITVSQEQVEYAKSYCKGLPIAILLRDYREIDGRYDRILSIGMFEHVGFRNYATYMQTVRNLLEPDGLFLLHTIGSPVSRTGTDPWIAKYIFPNSMLPSAAQITRACERRFVIEDWHNFGADYDRTLMQWHANFEAAWPELEARYGERFHRMWRYYLLMAAGAFRARSNQLWQIVLSPRGVPGGYRSQR